MSERWDVVVVGGGHAGCEAALAAARMGRRTLLLTGDLNSIARLSCNPSMGGPAKGHLVREIAALGGAMGHITDRTAIQVRLLNSGKGPAVQALRAQLDKDLYPATMRDVLAAQEGLELRAAMVTGLLLDAESEGAGPCARGRSRHCQRRARGSPERCRHDGYVSQRAHDRRRAHHTRRPSR